MKHKRCILVGDSSVGKTSFLIACQTKDPFLDYVPVVVDDYQIINNEQNITLDFVDTCNKISYENSCETYYNDADLFLFCFSIINRKSFNNIEKKWLPDVRKANKRSPIVLLGMKSDFRDEVLSHDFQEKIEMIPQFECEKLKKKIKAYDYIECSSKHQKNINIIIENCLNYFSIKNDYKCLIF